MEKGKYFAAMNRIYYGLFYVVNCLALIDGFTTSKHTQLIGYFNISVNSITIRIM
jgi:uncharacterized protein (UPF0332 family)